jgi:hypothetical protein
MDEVLKAYGEKKYSDQLAELLDFDPELGFNPYFWISRREIEKMKACAPAVQRYREIVRGWNTEEMLKGQAFGL